MSICRHCISTFLVCVILATLGSGELVAQATSKLKVLCWNIQRGSNHFDDGPEKALKVIRDSGAELLLLQESYDVDGDRPTLGRWIAKQLGWHVYQDKSPHLCIVSRYPIEKTFFHHDWHGIGAQIKLSERVSVVAYSIWIDYRSYVPEFLRDNPDATNEELIACETDHSNRMNQAKAIVEHLKANGHLDAGVPVVVAGDWNCPSHLDWTASTESKLSFRRNLELPVSLLMERSGFRDAFRELFPDPVEKMGNTWSPLYRTDDRGTKPLDRIDRVYFKNGNGSFHLRPAKSHVMPQELEEESIPQSERKFPSDHGAVFVEFDVQKANEDADVDRLVATLLVEPKPTRPATDWLIDNQDFPATLYKSADGKSIVLSNGLIRREWRIRPNGACVAFDDLMTDRSLVRSIRPEARVTIDGKSYDVGGLIGQKNHAFISPHEIDRLQSDPKAFQLVGFDFGPIQKRLEWARVRHASPLAQWPPQGVHLRLDFRIGDVVPPRNLNDILDLIEDGDHLAYVSVHYVMYDGVPCLSKWITYQNRSSIEGVSFRNLNRMTTEILALVEKSSWVEKREGIKLERPDYLHVETDFAFGGFNYQNANRHVVHWRPDPAFHTQVNYLKETPCLLEVEPTVGPEQTVQYGEELESYRTFELVFDSSDRERRGLALRRMYRVIAPWITENPLMMHLRVSDVDSVKRAIDQCKEVGFEMLILSFGSGFDIENSDPNYIEQWKQLSGYARQQGVELGGYSLLASRRVGNGNDVVSPPGQKPTFGNSPALTSKWGQEYFAKLKNFFEQTDFRLLEHDGSYPGDIDVTPRPPLQKGELDSRWVQWKIITEWYKWCRARGVYLNVPDYYYLSGSNKCGMGYRETNWSLPRAQQLIHTRQNIFDGTWTKTPSMGWMFVPLTEYHGGGAAATIEPLHQHLDHYRQMLQSNLGMGVQACFRGPRLFDTDETREMVANKVAWFKKYRAILESDVIHGRRADGKDLDWMLHVNPNLTRRGMLVVYNPTELPITKTLFPNLYYSGIADSAQLTWSSGKQAVVSLSRDYSIAIDVEVPANAMEWIVIESRDQTSDKEIDEP